MSRVSSLLLAAAPVISAAAHPQSYWANLTDAIWSSPNSPRSLRYAVEQHPKSGLSHVLSGAMSGVRIQRLVKGGNGEVVHIHTPQCDAVAKQIVPHDSARGHEDAFCHEVEMMLHAASVDAGPRVYHIDEERDLVIMQHHPVPLISELQCVLRDLESPQLQPSERLVLEAHARTRCDEYRGAVQRLTRSGMVLRDLKPEHIVVDLPPSPGVKLMDFGFARCCDTGEGAAPFDSLNHRWHLLQPNASDDEESCLGWANRSRIDHRARHEGFSVLNPASGRWCDQFRSLSVLSWSSSMEAPRGECGPEPREPVEQRLPAGCARSKGAGPRAYHIDEKRGLVIMQHDPKSKVVGSTMQMKMAGSQVRAASVGLHDEKRGSLVILQSTKASPREWPNPKTPSMPLRRNPW